MPRRRDARGLRRWAGSAACLACLAAWALGPPGAPAGIASAGEAAAEAPVSAFRFAADERVRRAIDVKRVVKGILRPDPKDGIPAIRSPAAAPAADADYVRDGEDVIGVVFGRESRAYPVRIMDFHEVVNDMLGGEPVAVTYCPLCDSAVAFLRRLPAEGKEPGRTLTLGVSGYLYDSDVLLYDAETESFWQQFTAKAVVGPLTGTALPAIPTERTTWAAWKALHPGTSALSWRTEHRLPLSAYDRAPYADYRHSGKPSFPVGAESARLPAKSAVYGIAAGGVFAAVPASALAGRVRPLEGEVGGLQVRIPPPGPDGPVRAEVEERPAYPAGSSHWRDLPVLRCYWFAWYAFHPDTSVLGEDAPAGPLPRAGGAK